MKRSTRIEAKLNSLKKKLDEANKTLKTAKKKEEKKIEGIITRAIKRIESDEELRSIIKIIDLYITKETERKFLGLDDIKTKEPEEQEKPEASDKAS